MIELYDQIRMYLLDRLDYNTSKQDIDRFIFEYNNTFILPIDFKLLFGGSIKDTNYEIERERCIGVIYFYSKGVLIFIPNEEGRKIRLPSFILKKSNEDIIFESLVKDQFMWGGYLKNNMFYFYKDRDTYIYLYITSGRSEELKNWFIDKF